jgi:hypothetical protein
MTPIFRREAYELLWLALQRIPEDRLGSDSGLETLWCGLAVTRFPKWPPCVALAHTSVVHLNTHTIHRFDKDERKHYFDARVNLMPYLNLHFAAEMHAARTFIANASTSNSLRRKSGAANGVQCWGL